MCSCGSEDGCIGLEEGCRCVCHHHDLSEKLVAMRNQIKDLVRSNRADTDAALRQREVLNLQVESLKAELTDARAMSAAIVRDGAPEASKIMLIKMEEALVASDLQVQALRDAIEKVLADEETGKGWGPDRTMAFVLQAALDGTSDKRVGEQPSGPLAPEPGRESPASPVG